MRAAIDNSLPVQAEMGGQNPAIVLPDADLTSLAGHLTLGAMSYSGQKCTATRRILIVGDSKRYNEVRECEGQEQLICERYAKHPTHRFRQ